MTIKKPRKDNYRIQQRIHTKTLNNTKEFQSNKNTIISKRKLKET